MVSVRLRRRYGLPLEGETGLDAHHERLLCHLDARHTVEEMRELVAQFEGFRSLVMAVDQSNGKSGVPALRPQVTSVQNEQLNGHSHRIDDSYVREKYKLPPSGPLSLNRERIDKLIYLERNIQAYQNDPKMAGAIRDWRQLMRGILAEQRFVSAWTHDNFCQPGVKLVRGATLREDTVDKADAIMELVDGRIWKFQVKTGRQGSFEEFARIGVVLVRTKYDYTPVQIRAAAIRAMFDYLEFKKSLIPLPLYLDDAETGIKIELSWAALQPQFRNLPLSDVSFAHLNARAQEVVRSYGKATLACQVTTPHGATQVIHAPK